MVDSYAGAVFMHTQTGVWSQQQAITLGLPSGIWQGNHPEFGKAISFNIAGTLVVAGNHVGAVKSTYSKFVIVFAYNV